jgi:hypothetical protein
MPSDDIPDTGNRQAWCELPATITSQVSVAQPARCCSAPRAFANLRDFVAGDSGLGFLIAFPLLACFIFAQVYRYCRIQDTIDRRFFRKKYDAQQVLAQFAQTARDETDPSLALRIGLDALTAELVRVVQETLQPEHVSVWLRETKSPKGE